MDTILLRPLSENWGWILFRGILAILFGLLAFAWPTLTLFTLVILYGAYVLVDGLFALVAAVKGDSRAPRWWLALVGVLGIAAGILVLVWPGFGALALLLIIGVTAIVRGVFEIVGAIALRKEISHEWLLILSGLASVAFGVIMVLFPGGGAVALVWLIAAYAICFGVLLTAWAFRLRKHRKAVAVAA